MKWTKTSPWGNYLDPEQNHKPTNMRNQMIIRQAQALRLDGKHAGSKSIDRLLKNIRFYSRALNMMKKFESKLKTEEKSDE